MKTCYVYVRVSSDIQDYQRQITSTSNYCKNNGLTILNTFEEKESGKKRVRKALTALYNACSTTPVDFVVVDELSRLGRTSESLTTVEILADSKICVVCIKEGLKSLNPDGSIDDTQIMMYYVNAGIYRNELVRAKDRFKDGIVEAAKRGQFSGGKNVPYGFKVVKKAVNGSEKIRGFLEVQPEEQQILIKLFDKFLAGDGVRKLGLWLNSTGFKTRSGKNWNNGSIYSILTNRILTGVRILPDATVVNSYPVVIDSETFNKVQNLMKSKGNKLNINKKYDYLLDGGLIKCGCCGRSFQAHKSSTGKQNVYSCLSKAYTLTQPSCGNAGVNIDKLEKGVQDVIINYLPESIQDNIDVSKYDNRIEVIKTDLLGYDVELKSEKKKEANLLYNAISGGFDPELVQTLLSTIKKDQATITQTILSLNKELKEVTDIKDNAVNLPALIQSLKLNGISKDILKKLVEKIVITPSTENLSTAKNDVTSLINIYFFDGGEISFFTSSRTNDYKLNTIQGISIINADRTRYQILKDFKNTLEASRSVLLK